MSEKTGLSEHERMQASVVRHINETLTPQNSVAVSQNGKGEFSYDVKVYAEKEEEAMNRALAIAEKLSAKLGKPLPGGI